MTHDNRVTRELLAVARLCRTIVPSDEIDQGAAEFREILARMLESQPFTDDIAVGIALGVWSMAGGLHSVEDEIAETQDIALAAAGKRICDRLSAVANMLLTHVQSIREGIEASAAFDFTAFEAGA